MANRSQLNREKQTLCKAATGKVRIEIRSQHAKTHRAKLSEQRCVPEPTPTDGERKIDRLIPLTTRHRQAKEQAQDTFWELFKSLQAYRLEPTGSDKETIGGRFDRLCQTKTGYPDLHEALSLLHAKRDTFLAVLEYPHLPLHNNLSENDIREYARLRKISGETRSDSGRRCRDTFMSLKKTCRKLGVSFQAYLRDRLSGGKEILLLADLMRTAANESSHRVVTIGSG